MIAVGRGVGFLWFSVPASRTTRQGSMIGSLDPNSDGIFGEKLSRRVIVDGSQVSHPKPAPDLYLLAAAELGIAPRNCVVFEDSAVGVAAARAAGMRVVGVLTYPSPLEGIQFAVPDFLDPGLDQWLSAQRSE